jgi:hypothetical protein
MMARLALSAAVLPLVQIDFQFALRPAALIAGSSDRFGANPEFEAIRVPGVAHRIAVRESKYR